VNSLEIVVALHGKDPRDHLRAGGNRGTFKHLAWLKEWKPDPTLAAILAGGHG
jgi:hypothetical protein